jgi:nanoRNase/pAp phosphatase (c-di-AMP/oligoRNAs hydrolase)
MRTHVDTIDLGEICKSFGGGGHKSAAAFSGNKNFFDGIIVESIQLEKYVRKIK